jgi:spoIIIJ-associated protein
MAELETFLKEKTQKITESMGIAADVSVADSDEQFTVNLTPKDEADTPLLIGFHGQTLNALQTVLRAFVYRKIASQKDKDGEFPNILVEAGGYRQERDQELKRRAYEAADKARFLLKEVSFPAMTSYERRIIHSALSDEKGVYTESRGEGRERHVVVVPGEKPAEDSSQ